LVFNPQEDTPTAKSLNSVLVYTEADDTANTSFTIHPSTPVATAVLQQPISPISLLDLATPLTRAILSILFSDCIAKFDTPGWYAVARVILALSPEEEDWLEAQYCGFPDADALANATWTPDAPVWHAEACRDHRIYRHLSLEQDPAPVLAWLNDEQSTRQYGKVDVGMREVQLAVRYLRARGFREVTIEKFDLEAYVNLEDKREGDGDSGNNGEGEDEGEGDGKGDGIGVQDEAVETVEVDDAVMTNVDTDGKTDVGVDSSSPARNEAKRSV
jgi:hypothetical protein